MHRTHKTNNSAQLSERTFLQRHPVAVFLLLTFVVSHLLNPVVVELVTLLFAFSGISFPMGKSLLNQYGGTLAGLFVVRKVYGNRGLRSTLRYLRPAPRHIPWLLLAFLLPLVLIGASYALAGISLETLVEIFGRQFAAYVALIASFLITAGFAEEYGWRGFLLPQQLHRFSPLFATVVVFLVVSLWHFPALLSGWKNEPLLPWLLLSLFLAVVHSWLFLASGGGLPVVILFHACFDAQYAFFSRFLSAEGLPNNPFHQGWAYVSLYGLLSLLIVVGTKGRLGYDKERFNPAHYFGREQEQDPNAGAEKGNGNAQPQPQ